MHVQGYGAPETKAAVAQVERDRESGTARITSRDPALLLSALLGPVDRQFP